MAKQRITSADGRVSRAKSDNCESNDGPDEIDDYWDRHPVQRPPHRSAASHPYFRKRPREECVAFEAAITTLEAKLDQLRDVVRGVAKGFHTGLFVHGEGGTSKSYTVLKQLQELKAKFVLHNSRLTGRGLVDALSRAPTDIHVIEDAETLLDDKKSFGVLRSALWSQSTKKPMERRVTWGAFKQHIDFIFTGGIIVISNDNLAEAIPEVRAIKSRINILRMDVSAEEIKALMTKICLAGFEYGDLFLHYEQCFEVRDFIIARSSELQRNLDVRLLINGFRDYLQWRAGESKSHWQALLEARMQERVSSYQSRDAQNRAKTKGALEIRARNVPWKEQCRLAKEMLGLSPAAYARAVKRPI